MQGETARYAVIASVSKKLEYALKITLYLGKTIQKYHPWSLNKSPLVQL